MRRLKQAGAVILGKACLSEFAYWVARKRKMPSGYSSRGKDRSSIPMIRNWIRPERLRFGSRRRSGIGAVFDRHGNQRIAGFPARNNAVATIKPTVGLISRHGIIPISVIQDTAGPMGKTIADCALVLDALWGEG